MNVLILGSGGREHALAWRMAQDESTTKVYSWPGNPGFDFLPFEQKEKLKSISVSFSKENLKEIIETCQIKLIVPGAEKFLYEGVSDWCETWDVPCFGPSQKAASLERSKLFSKKIMEEAQIPTAAYEDLSSVFKGSIDDAALILNKFKMPVIKVSGPSLGKGVFVCHDHNEAYATLKQLKETPIPGMEEGLFVEEGLSGKEVSLFYACHDQDFLFLGAAQDHKRLLDQDLGPNTGGMGTVTPIPWVTDEFIKQATADFLQPTLNCMSEKGIPFKGVLFLGLMVTESGSYLLEYNVRFGDPETQVLLPMIKGDFSQVLYQFSCGKKADPLQLREGSAVHVVKAAKGYPGNFGAEVEKGQRITTLLTENSQSQVFFAGVRRNGSDLVTDGGRVLGVTSWGKDRNEARNLAYKKLSELTFSGEQFRLDIGGKI